ncbi:MAG: hypothetical protein LC791_19935 [Acidobacteria bacterium]|nr:hypothetical protein [Acidobacteriota bacterium]
MGLVHEDDHAVEYSAHLTSYASVHASSVSLPWVRIETTGDQALYPGMVLLLPLVAIATFGPRRSFTGRGHVAMLYAVVGAAALWLSFGPEIRAADGVLVTSSPYGWLREHVPGLSAVRAPGRFAAIVSLALAALGALAAAGLTARMTANARAALLAAAIGVIGLEAWPAALAVEPLSPEGRPVDRELYAWLARQPAAGLLELPASPTTAQIPGVELFHQFATLQHPHRLVNGYSGFNPPLANLFEDHASPFIDLARLPEGLALLHSMAVRFVVIHPHDYATPGLATRLVTQLRTLPGVRAEHQVGAHHIFELEPAPRRSSSLPRAQ